MQTAPSIPKDSSPPNVVSELSQVPELSTIGTILEVLNVTSERRAAGLTALSVIVAAAAADALGAGECFAKSALASESMATAHLKC